MPRKKLTNEFIEKILKNEDFILTSEYINSKTKFSFICPNGHDHSTTWDSWRQGRRCGRCKGNIEITYDTVKESFEKENYIPKFTEYINCSTKLDYICPNGHYNSMIWSSWQQGVRCPSCAGNKKLTIEFISEEFKKEGYILLTNEYINSKTKLYYTCPNGHKNSTTWSNWKKGHRCPYFCGTSKFEQEVKNFILTLNQEIIKNDRTTILNPNTNHMLELDILFPCKTKAIECNGVYWHSKPKAKEKDKIKQDQCKSLGINLLTITDEEWYNDREECETKIHKLLAHVG